MRVHDLVPEAVWSRRFDQINAFEKILCENDVRILKFFLHISKEEQKKRFKRRLSDESRHWKISPSDFKERPHWEEYVHAYEDVLTRCSTECAPWHIIPADKKWFRNLAVARIITEQLEALDMAFPEPQIDVSKVQID